MKLSFLIPIITLVAYGCGSSTPDSQVETSRLQAAQEMRKLFEKAGGNYESLTAQDKASFLKQFKGNESDSQKAWNAMRERAAGSMEASTGDSTTVPGR